MPPKKPPLIYVIAGVNGAGKSSIQGAAILKANAHYYNSDEAAARLMADDPNLTQVAANSKAWHNGVEFLRKRPSKKGWTFPSSLLGPRPFPDYYATRLMKDFTFASGMLGSPVQSYTLLACASELAAVVTQVLRLIFDAATNGAVSSIRVSFLAKHSEFQHRSHGGFRSRSIDVPDAFGGTLNH